jgi:predicted choloylglycine hydrolase
MSITRLASFTLKTLCVVGIAGMALADDPPEVTLENGILYIEVEGTPYEMGVQHGRALAEQVKRSVVEYKSNVVATFGEENARKILDWALNKAEFKRDIKKYLPYAWEEMKGIADGAGVSMDDVLLLQMFEEVYEVAPVKVGLKLEEFFGAGCTAFVVEGNGKRFAGQNMDYSGNLQEKQLVVRYKGAEKQLLVYGFVGSVGGIGVNSKGLSVFTNTLPQAEKRDHDGLGSAFVLRAILEQDSVDAAIEELKRIPRFGSQAYTMADFDRGVIAETSSNEMALRELSSKQQVLVHTNHVLQLEKRNDIPTLFEDGEPVPGMPFLSLERLLAADLKLKAAVKNLTVDKAKGVLLETPNNIWTPLFMTIQSAIAGYEGKTVRFYASAGYDPLRGWNEYGF